MDAFKTIIFKAKEDVYSHLQGANFSKLLGQGYDFSELRPYEASDDIRHISWVNSAKLAEPYVKKMHEERELLVHVAMLLDGRAVIGQKQKLMLEVLAILGYSTIFTNNLLSISFCLGKNFRTFEATKNVEAFDDTLEVFSKIDALGLEIDYANLQKRLVEVQEKKSLFFVVGDFLDEVDFSVLAQKHQLCVLMVRDRWEENPLLSADAELLNPLNNEIMRKTVSKKALKHYVEQLKEHDTKLYAHFHEHNIKYVKIYEPERIVEKLEQLFYFD